MAKLNAPCYNVEQGKDCPFRTVGCHATCELYKVFQAEVAEVREKARVQKEDPVTVYECDKLTKALKRRGTLYG